jgi:fructose-bisphosphate aldolase class I
MSRLIGGRYAAEYLWDIKKIVPFLKIDDGLAEPSDGAQITKPIPSLSDVLGRARDHRMFGTRMRSFIEQPGAGLHAVVEQQFAVVVEQQFAVAQQVIAAEPVPIVGIGVDILSPRKREAEELLKLALLTELEMVHTDQLITFELTLPETDNLNRPLVEHRNGLPGLAVVPGNVVNAFDG